MAKCVIFCAGGFTELLEPIAPEDLVIAADGGLAHLQKLNAEPRVILGDFDSLGFVPADARVFPVEKDDTDAMLAVRHGLMAGYDQFLLYGTLDGPRLDHTVANFQTLQFLAERGATGYLIGVDYIATVVKNGTISFPSTADGIISLFCMGEPAAGVTLKGLKYELDNAALHAGHPLGVSNHFTGKPATVTVQNGSLLVLYDRAVGLCNR